MLVYAPSLAEAIMKLYPEAQPGIDFRVEQLGDEPQEIVEWNLPDKKPSESELIPLAEELALDYCKGIKKEELSTLCTEEILNGTTVEIGGAIYRFKNDEQTSSNLREAKEALEDGFVDIYTVSAYDPETGEKVRINVDADQLKDIRKALFLHKTERINRYNDILEKKLNISKKFNDIVEISWS